MQKWSPFVLSVLRIIAALLFLEHGLMKLISFPGPQPGITGPLPGLLIAAALIEIVGGTLLIVGLFTRTAAFVCSGQMAVGYFISHASKGFWPGLNGGDAASLFCFIFLYVAIAGGGPIGVDRLRSVARQRHGRENFDRSSADRSEGE